MSEIPAYSHDVKVVSRPAEAPAAPGADPAYTPTPVEDPRFHTREQYAGLNAEAQARLRAAQEHAAKVLRAAHEDAADVLRTTAIANRTLGVEGTPSDVALLNDQAEMLIYGSKGRTYHDPETGSVIADKEHQIPSVFDRIRDDKRWGDTEAEREDVAKGFENELNKLLEEGFELTQASIIMDKRLGDYQHVKESTDRWEKGTSARVRKLLSTGIPPKTEEERKARLAEAQDYIKEDNEKQVARLHKKLDKEDAELKQLIREKGIFSQEDLARAQAGEDLYDGATYKKKAAETGTTTPEQDAQAAKERAARDVLDAHRRRYAKAEAMRSRRALTLGGDRTRKSVDETYRAYRQALSDSLATQLEGMQEAGIDMSEEQTKNHLLLEIAEDAKRVAEERSYYQEIALGIRDKEGTLKDPDNLNIRQRAAMKLRHLWYNMNPQSYRAEIIEDTAEAQHDLALNDRVTHKHGGLMIDRLVHEQVQDRTDKEVKNNRIRRGSMLGLAAIASSSVGVAFADTIGHGFHGIFGGGNKHSAADLAKPGHGHYQPHEKHELGYPRHGHYQPEAGAGTGAEHVKLGDAEFPSQYFDQHNLDLDATVRKAQEAGLGIHRVGLPGGRYFLELVKPNGDKVTDSTQRVVDALQPYIVKK